MSAKRQKQNEENLKELLEKFGMGRQAEQDFHGTEQLIGQYPAPAPDQKLIADIKAQSVKALRQNRVRTLRRKVYKTAVAAAAVIVLAILSLTLPKNEIEREKKISF